MSSSPLNVKSGRTVSAAHMRLRKHRVKQPQLHRPTNYSAVYLELMACILWSCPVFILIRQFRPREGESQLRAHLGLTIKDVTARIDDSNVFDFAGMIVLS